MDNTTVFTGKAQFYNSRPTYPQECIDYVIKKWGYPPAVSLPISEPVRVF